MSEITVGDIENEFTAFCNSNTCEKCCYMNTGDCKSAFVYDRYDVEIKKKDPFETIKKDVEKMKKEFENFCDKHDKCEECPLYSPICDVVFIVAKERGKL